MSEKELRQGKNQVFIEKIKNHLTLPYVVKPAMHQQQFPQISELAQSVVAGLDCLDAFFPVEPDADMSLEDHGHVVGAVSNGQSDGSTVVFD